MNMRTCLLVILTTLTPSLAGGSEAGAVYDPNGELALRLFAEREWPRRSQLPYVFVYPLPCNFPRRRLNNRTAQCFTGCGNPTGLPVGRGAVLAFRLP